MIPHVGDLVSYRGVLWLVEVVTHETLRLSRLTSTFSKCRVRVRAQKVKVL